MQLTVVDARTTAQSRSLWSVRVLLVTSFVILGVVPGVALIQETNVSAETMTIQPHISNDMVEFPDDPISNQLGSSAT